MLDMETIPRLPDWGARDQLSELQQQIDQMHFSYLETDDSPQKIEQRQKLEGYIREFLCLVPHSRKFLLRETLQVLHKSAASHENFSGYRAALAWNAIARYAANLLTQPWRKEYKEIKLYCGFYKHEIEENLIGAEIMFEAMGYKRIDQSTLLLEGPICPDQVAHVSRDALVAVVECQLLKTVWEHVSSVCTVKWLEALQFRELHIGGPEQACRALLYRHNERSYQQKQQQQDGTTSGGRMPVTTMINNGTDVHPHQQLYHQHHNHNNYPVPQQQQQITSPVDFASTNTPLNIYGQQQYGQLHNHPIAMNSQQQYMPQYGYQQQQPVYSPMVPMVPYMNQMYPSYMMPPSYMNGVRVNNDQLMMINNGYISGGNVVATGQLIEVDALSTESGSDGRHNTFPVRKQHHREDSFEDEVDSTRLTKPQAMTKQTNNDKHRSEKLNNNDNNRTAGNKENTRSEESFENWDYVYRDLEKQGYNKDLGDRDNILLVEKNLRRRNDHLEKAFQSKMSLQKKNTDDTGNRNNENVTRNDEKTKTDEKAAKNDKSKVDNVTKRDVSSSKKVTPANVKKSAGVGQWQCLACTYNNQDRVDICDMCGKSRRGVTEIAPLTSGGRECSKCTLVNDRDSTVCGACGASLRDSPTYI